MKNRQIAMLLAAGAIALAASTACSSSKPGKATPALNPSAAVSLGQYPLPPAADLSSNPTLVKAVTITKCTPLVGGGHRAIGVAKNVGAKPVRLKITVYFNRTNGANSPVNWAVTEVSVPQGRSVPWVTEKAFRASTNLVCAVKAVRAVTEVSE